MSNRFRFKFSEILRGIWHDIYYFFATDKGVQFAMKCKDAAEQVDLGISKNRTGRFRYFLHITLCQGCRNYEKTSDTLKSAVKKTLEKNPKSDRLDRLNNELLKKYTD